MYVLPIYNLQILLFLGDINAHLYANSLNAKTVFMQRSLKYQLLLCITINIIFA